MVDQVPQERGGRLVEKRDVDLASARLTHARRDRSQHLFGSIHGQIDIGTIPRLPHGL